MINLNLTVQIGTVYKEPTIQRDLPGGKTIGKFLLRTIEKYETGESRQIHSIVVRGRLAERCMYLSPGDIVVVIGSNRYEIKDYPIHPDANTCTADCPNARTKKTKFFADVEAKYIEFPTHVKRELNEQFSTKSIS